MADSRYVHYHLKEELSIESLITFYYMETGKNFYTSGEKHDFWEMVYVDKGEVEVATDSNRFELSQGDMIFYKPNEFHGGQAKTGNALNLVIVSFECQSSCMTFFEGKSFRLEEDERMILSIVVKEGLEAFYPSIDSPYIKFPQRKSDSLFGCEQLIKNYLETLFIMLIRRGKSQRHERTPYVSMEKKNNELLTDVIEYMNDNLTKELTADDICSKFSIGRTSLKNLIKEKTGLGIMECYKKLKIERAKILIREKEFYFTEIAEQLGYSSVHYFSKQFKKQVGMTPTEYARSVRARTTRRE